MFDPPIRRGVRILAKQALEFLNDVTQGASFWLRLLDEQKVETFSNKKSHRTSSMAFSH